MPRQTERFSTFVSDNFFAIHPRDVDATRPWLVPYLEEFANKTGLVHPEVVIQQAKDCDCQLWSYYDGEKCRGVVATRIHTTAVGKLCSLWLCIAIEADEIIDGFYAEIEKWARSIGCYAIEISGREGWLRKLKGFRKKAVILEKLLVGVN